MAIYDEQFLSRKNLTEYCKRRIRECQAMLDANIQDKRLRREYLERINKFQRLLDSIEEGLSSP